jgi:uncharacterized membrane protein
VPAPYLLHAAAVHFPIALLLAGWVLSAASLSRPASPWLSPAASCLLGAGTAAVWLALGLGLLAESSVPHVPLAWKTLLVHKRLGYATAAAFTALCALRTVRRGPWTGPLVAAWLACCGLLVATAGEGGELVFSHGVGVVAEAP